MPTYDVTAPDGKVYEITAPEGASQEDVLAYAQSMYGQPQAPKTKEGVGTSVRRGVEQLGSAFQTAYESVTKGGEEAAIRAQERQADIQRRLGEGASLERLKKVYEERGILPAAGELVSQIPQAIAEQAPNIAATLGGAAAGAAAGSVVPGVGTLIGGIAGAALPSFVQQYGGNIQRQAEAQVAQGKPLEISRAAAAGTAVPQATLDVIGTLVPLGGNMITKILGPTMGKVLASGGSKIADEALLTTITKGTAKGIAAEVPTEVSQQILERAQAGLPLTTPDALKEYGETAFAVSLLGPIGIIGRVSDKAQAGRDLALARQKAAEENTPQPVTIQTVDSPEPQVMYVAPTGEVAKSMEELDAALKYKQYYADLNKPATVTPKTPEVLYGTAQGDVGTSMEDVGQAKMFREQALARQAELQKVITPEKIKGLGIGSTASIFKDNSIMNQSLSNPDVADATRAKLLDIQSKNTNAQTKAKISDFLNRPEFITPKYVDELLNPPLEMSRKEAAALNKQQFAFIDKDGQIKVKYGDIITKDGKQYAKYEGGGERQITDDVMVNPSPALMESWLLSKEEDKVSKIPDDFKEYLAKRKISTSELSDLNMNDIPKTKKGSSLYKTYFSGQGVSIDELVNDAISNGLLNEEDVLRHGKDVTDGMRELIREALVNDARVPYTPQNNEALNREFDIAQRRNQLESALEETTTMVERERPTEPIDVGIQELTPEERAPIEAEASIRAAERFEGAPAVEPEITRAEVPYEFSEQAKRDMAKIIPRLTRTLDKMGLHNIGLNLAKNLKANIDGKITKVNGTYLNRIITLCLDNRGIEATLHHEAIHALKEMGLFSQKEWATLSKIAKDKWIDQYNINNRYPNASEEVKIEEAIASAFPDYMKQVGQPRGLLQRIKDFVQKVGNVFRGLGFNTPESVFAKAEAGKLTGEGKATQATQRAAVPTNTENFRNWFGNSKVVDENGQPKVMYHGTSNFVGQEFKPSAKVNRGGNIDGYYFTSEPSDASRYSLGKEEKFKEGAEVIPVYLSLQNPFVKGSKVTPKMLQVFKEEVIKNNPQLGDRAEEYANDKAEIMKEYGESGRRSAPEIFPNISFPTDAKQRVLKAGGYDGFQDGGSHWVAFDSNQIKSAIGNKGTFSKESPDIRFEVPSREKFKAPMQGVDPAYAEKLRNAFTQQPATVKEKMEGLKKNFFDRMVVGLFDEFRAIKKYDPVAYMMARLSKSIDGGLQGLLEYGQVFLRDGALDIKPNTKGLLKILEPVGSEVDQYQAWKALSRDANLPKDKRSLPADLVAGRDQLTQGTLNGKSRKAVYEQALREENELNKSVLNVAKELGLIDQQGYDKFASDIYYIPFYKQMEDGDVQSVSNASKLTGQQFSKALKGGEKQLNDLMENVLLNWSHILSAAMKNQAAVKTIDAAAKMGAATEVKPMDGKYPKGSVKVMRDGKAVHYELTDPDLVDAISTISYLGPKSQFLDIAKGFTNALRYGITMSPAYKVRNLIRDSIQSAAISELGNNMFKNVYDGLSMSKEGHPTFMAALAGGGIFEMGTAHEGNQAKLIKRLVDKGVSANHILDTTDKIKGKLGDLLNWYNEQGNKFENANRLALYQKLIDSGKTHLEASYAARDLMDFSMQGQFRSVKIIGSVVPFFNARLQGLYKLGRDGISPTYRVICNATTGKPLEIGDKQKAARFMTISSAVMLASLSLYAMYKDDEDFKRREDWDRDNFWWFKIGDTAYRIPKPFEIGALGTIAERTYEQMSDDTIEGKVFANRLNHILMDTFSLNPTPQMVKPLIDLYANKDSFTGAPIESAGMQNLSRQERVNNNTSGLAIALGGISEGAAKILTFNPDAQGLSPVQMDYAIKAYFGWLGATAASTADLAVEPFSEGTKVHKPIIDTVAMGFIKTEPELQSKYMTAFYQNNANLQSALADMRHYAELGDSAKVQEILEEKGQDIALAKVYDKASKQLAELRKQSRLIEQNQSIPAEERRAEMIRLKILMSDIAAQMETMRKTLKK